METCQFKKFSLYNPICNQAINESTAVPYPTCSPVPESACAVAYDKHDCIGGWKLVIPQGQVRFRWFTSYWKYRWEENRVNTIAQNNTIFRNDMETVGVKAGCSLQLFSDSSFNHYTVGVEARTSDRLVRTIMFIFFI